MLCLQNFLPYKISRLDNDLSAGLQRTYSLRFGLNVSQWRMLAAAAQLEPTSVTELTDYSGMDKVTVSRAVRELVDRELLARILNENDRRRATITLTEAGRSLYEQIAPEATAYEQELLSVLDGKELAALHGFLDRLLDQAAVLRQSRSRVFPVQPAAPAKPARKSRRSA
ncbi:MarR family transcriptional regulator [Verticiella sediminum]|uniref:MarR family transcriptional regulator n=1 Tax=Verticiella sediminum TaxID=1247510 RepID=A0A556ALU1_9BURK|nr:MarR family transcriptional regulator [Verticiella sediminum]TSH93852.1 MarR family transcriptional regulator [Verticiella sediminum]